jgi:hypothetical protein
MGVNRLRKKAEDRSVWAIILQRLYADEEEETATSYTLDSIEI